MVEFGDALVLALHGVAGEGHALAQGLEQRRQAADDLGALVAGDLGAGRPGQVGRGALHRARGLALGTGAQRAHRQHVGPDLEQELAHALLHRHMLEHLAQLDRVLDRLLLALLDLLGQRHALAAGLVGVLEVALEEALELGEHGLEHPPPGVGVGLDDLHDAADLGLERLTAGCGGAAVEAHHAGAHAVDQPPRGVVDGGEEVGLADGHAQHRHLQARKPHPHRGWQPLLGQDALEQQRDDLDRRALDRRGRGLLEGLLVALQGLEQRRRRDQRPLHGGGFQALADVALGHRQRVAERRRQRPRLGLGLERLPQRVGEAGQVAADQPRQPRQYRPSLLAMPARGQRRAARHQAGLLGRGARPAPASAPGLRRLAGRRARITGSARTERPCGQALPAGDRGVAAVGAERRLLLAPDHRPQVDLGQHAARGQRAVDFVVGGVRQFGKGQVQRRLQLAPAVEPQAGAAPAVDDDTGQHMRAQQVVGVELLAPLERGHARAHVGELRRHAVHHGQRQPRAEDLALDRVVVDQGQRPGPRRQRRLQRTRARTAVDQHVAQRTDHRLVPAGCAAVQSGGQLAAAKDHRCLGRAVAQQVGRLDDAVDQARQRLDQMLRVQAPRLRGQGGRVDVGHRSRRRAAAGRPTLHHGSGVRVVGICVLGGRAHQVLAPHAQPHRDARGDEDR